MVSEFIYEPMCTLWLSAFTHTPLQLRLLSHQFSRSSSFCSSLVPSPLPPFLQSVSKTHNSGVWAACEWGLLRWSNSEMVPNGFAAESGCNIAARFDWAVIDPEEGSISQKYLWSISLPVYPSFAFSQTLQINILLIRFALSASIPAVCCVVKCREIYWMCICYSVFSLGAFCTAECFSGVVFYLSQLSFGVIVLVLAY